MELPTITVITVVYNSANTIEQTISSVVNQTYPNLEYIVIDGGSTDGTVDVIKKYEAKISYWVSEKDAGIYDAMNKGVRVATGDYIEFLNSDDCFCSYDVLEKVAQEIDGTDILSCGIYIVDEKYLLERIFGNEFAIDKKEYCGGMIPHPGMFTRKELLEKYPFDTKYKIAGDYKFFLTCYFDEAVKIKYISLPTVFFSNGGISGGDEMGQEVEEINCYFGVRECVSAQGRLVLFLKKILGEQLYMQLHERIWIRIRNQFGKHHHCNNKICRWCGREG